ncbi:hypothetical protein Tco_0682306 [Tanacetum coccineum]|uniref:Uncharacterized protein n=1 Tax=Tanacetum coccineum TaxID=301880 RepID=A0ABQ4XSB0_9ASTR
MVKQRHRKSKRKDTEIPQSSGPTNNVADEAVNKEMDDSLERAATTATSLDAEQDRGNINKTQSKATPNEAGSQGTTSGGGSRRQETMRDTIAQTRFENVSKTSNDPLLTRETTKTTQANEIASLKRSVKKLERRNKSRTHRLKRIYRVGSSRMVESFEDEGLGEEDASKQGRIADINANKDIYLVNVCTDEDMFDVNYLDGDEDKGKGIMIEEPYKLKVEEERLAREKAHQTKEANIAWDDIQAKIEVDYQLAQRLQAQEQEELTDEEKGKIQKVDEDKEAAELKSLVEVISDDEEEVAIDVVPLATKPPTIVDWKIHKEGKKSYYQIIRADGKLQMYRVFSQMLKSFSREDLVDLYKLVKAEYGSTRPVEDLD